MPTYEYKCAACGHAFEKFQSITAAPIKACPQCKKNKVNRLIGTGAGLIFKGSGFYITDYRSDSYKNAAKSDGGGASSAGSANGSASAPSSNGSAAAAAGPSSSTAPSSTATSTGSSSSGGEKIVAPSPAKSSSKKK